MSSRVNMLGTQSVQGAVEFLAQSGHRDGRGPALGNDVAVCCRKQFLVQTVVFPQQALDPVSHDSTTHLAAHRNAEPPPRPRTLDPDEDKVRRMERASVSGQVEVLAAGPEPLMFRIVAR